MSQEYSNEEFEKQELLDQIIQYNKNINICGNNEDQSFDMKSINSRQSVDLAAIKRYGNASNAKLIQILQKKPPRKPKDSLFIFEKIKDNRAFSKFIFDHLSTSNKEAAYNICKNLSYEKFYQGQYVFSERDFSNNKFYIIFRGHVSVVKRKKDIFSDENNLMAISNVQKIQEDLSSDSNEMVSSDGDLSSFVSERELKDEIGNDVKGRSLKTPQVVVASQILNATKKFSSPIGRRTTTVQFQNILKQFSLTPDKKKQSDILICNYRQRDTNNSIFSNKKVSMFKQLNQTQSNPKIKQVGIVQKQDRKISQMPASIIGNKNPYAPGDGRSPLRHQKVFIQPRQQKLRKIMTKVEIKEQIQKEGYKVSELGPEDGFGEIALLATNQSLARRTASIFCQTDCEFLVIHRINFIKILRKYDQASKQKEQILLQHIPYLKKVVNQNTLQQLCYSFKEVNLYKGHKIVTEDVYMREKNIYLILNGQCSVSKNCLDLSNGYYPEMKSVVLCYLNKNEIFGEEILFNQSSKYTYSITVVSSICKVLYVSKYNLEIRFPKETRQELYQNYIEKDKFRSNKLLTLVNKNLKVHNIFSPQQLYEQFHLHNNYDLFDNMSQKMKTNLKNSIQKKSFKQYLENGLITYDNFMEFNSNVNGVKYKIQQNLKQKKEQQKIQKKRFKHFLKLVKNIKNRNATLKQKQPSQLYDSTKLNYSSISNISQNQYQDDDRQKNQLNLAIEQQYEEQNEGQKDQCIRGEQNVIKNNNQLQRKKMLLNPTELTEQYSSKGEEIVSVQKHQKIVNGFQIKPKETFDFGYSQLNEKRNQILYQKVSGLINKRTRNSQDISKSKNINAMKSIFNIRHKFQIMKYNQEIQTKKLIQNSCIDNISFNYSSHIIQSKKLNLSAISNTQQKQQFEKLYFSQQQFMKGSQVKKLKQKSLSLLIDNNQQDSTNVGDPNLSLTKNSFYQNYKPFSTSNLIQDFKRKFDQKKHNNSKDQNDFFKLTHQNILLQKKNQLFKSVHKKASLSQQLFQQTIPYFNNHDYKKQKDYKGNNSQFEDGLYLITHKSTEAKDKNFAIENKIILHKKNQFVLYKNFENSKHQL